MILVIPERLQRQVDTLCVQILRSMRARYKHTGGTTENLKPRYVP